MIWWKHDPQNFDVVHPIAQSTSELASHAISRLLNSDDVCYSISAFDFRRGRLAEAYRIIQYLENSSVESGQPPNPQTVEWVLEGVHARTN